MYPLNCVKKNFLHDVFKRLMNNQVHLPWGGTCLFVRAKALMLYMQKHQCKYIKRREK